MIPTRTMEQRGDVLGFRPLTENETAEEVSHWLGEQLVNAHLFAQHPNEAARIQAQEAIQLYTQLLDTLNSGQALTYSGAYAQTLFGSPAPRVIQKPLPVNIIEPESP